MHRIAIYAAWGMVWGKYNKRSRLTEPDNRRALEILQYDAPQRVLLLIRTFHNGSLEFGPAAGIPVIVVE